MQATPPYSPTLWFAGSSEEHASFQLFDVALWVFSADGICEDAWSNYIDANAFWATPLLGEVAGDPGVLEALLAL